MKQLLTLFLALAIGFVAKADDKKKTDWPALTEFHTVMSQTFHPSEEGNFEPIRKRSEEMMNKAAALSRGRVPQPYQTPSMRNAVARLQVGAKTVNEMVQKNATDEQLKPVLSKLHDTFHEIVGLCRKGDGEAGHDERGH
jgi:hypothetical protein